MGNIGKYGLDSETGDINNAVHVAKDVMEIGGYGLYTEPVLDSNGDTIFTS